MKDYRKGGNLREREATIRGTYSSTIFIALSFVSEVKHIKAGNGSK